MRVETFICGPLLNNVYLLRPEDGNAAAIVDPSIDSEGIWDHITKLGLKLELIINTHCHFDHCFNNSFFKEKSQAPLIAHKEDLFWLDSLSKVAENYGMSAEPSPQPDRLIEEGDLLKVGSEEVIVRHAPGHTPGEVVLALDGAVLVGDLIFQGSVGRFDLPGGDYEKLMDSISRLILPLNDETIIYPGHGPITTVGAERRYNPFLQEGFQLMDF